MSHFSATERLEVYKSTFPDGPVLFHHISMSQRVEPGSLWAELLRESRLSIQEGGE
jgi:hypothetical protein